MSPPEILFLHAPNPPGPGNADGVLQVNVRDVYRVVAQTNSTSIWLSGIGSLSVQESAASIVSACQALGMTVQTS